MGRLVHYWFRCIVLACLCCTWYLACCTWHVEICGTLRFRSWHVELLIVYETTKKIVVSTVSKAKADGLTPYDTKQ